MSWTRVRRPLASTWRIQSWQQPAVRILPDFQPGGRCAGPGARRPGGPAEQQGRACADERATCRHVLVTVEGAYHAGLDMPGDQAGELEIARAVEMPEDGAGSAWRHVGHVGLVVRHVRESLHQLGVRGQLLGRAEHELVHDAAGVADDEPHRLALAHLEAVGTEAHVVAHRHGEGAAGHARCGGDAQGFCSWRTGPAVAWVQSPWASASGPRARVRPVPHRLAQVATNRRRDGRVSCMVTGLNGASGRSACGRAPSCRPAPAGRAGPWSARAAARRSSS